jgi:prepilin-type N-terminal cleavage/methylation domain-containing protein
MRGEGPKKSCRGNRGNDGKRMKTQATQRPGTLPRSSGGFTLVELLVVIGIIALLIGMLMPALSRAKAQSKMVACASNMRQVGLTLLMYAQDNNGWIFPVGAGSGDFAKGLGTNVGFSERWTTVAFRPAVVNPQAMLCPEDPDVGGEDSKDNLQPDDPLYNAADPAGNIAKTKHSYILNMHVVFEDVKYSRTHGIASSDIIVMGEKTTAYYDYYMENATGNPTKKTGFTGCTSDYDLKVEPNRHGLRSGSNYLYLDIHVDNRRPVKKDPTFIDPWQILSIQDAWGTATTTGTGTGGTGTGGTGGTGTGGNP